jgi:hypothetical protein
VIVERKMRPRFRAMRRLVVRITDEDTGCRKRVVIDEARWFGSARGAYRWVATSFVFKLRLEQRRDNADCESCHRSFGSQCSDNDRDAPCGRYEPTWFERTRDRIARLLRHWDEAAARNPEVAEMVARIRRSA